MRLLLDLDRWRGYPQWGFYGSFGFDLPFVLFRYISALEYCPTCVQICTELYYNWTNQMENYDQNWTIILIQTRPHHLPQTQINTIPMTIIMSIVHDDLTSVNQPEYIHILQSLQHCHQHGDIKFIPITNNSTASSTIHLQILLIEMKIIYPNSASCWKSWKENYHDWVCGVLLEGMSLGWWVKASVGLGNSTFVHYVHSWKYQRFVLTGWL